MIAENRFDLSEELFREGFLAVQTNYKRFVRRLLAVLVLLWVGLTVFVLMRGESCFIVLLELVALGFVGTYAAVYLPKRRGKAAYEAILQRTGGDVLRHTCFYEDRFEVETGVEIVVVPYVDVIQKIDTPSLLILLDRDKRGFMIKKDAFIQGSLETVQSALEKAKKEEADHD